MDPIKSYTLKNGSVLVSINGYWGEDDFYMMYDIIKELLNPEQIKFGVDSMCVDGSFIKDGLLVRMSSESAYDYCCLVYDPSELSDADVDTIKSWIDQIVAKMHEKKAPVEKDDDEW